MTVEIKEKLTPKMLKGLSATPEQDQDYAVLFFFTENKFKTFEDCKEHWENVDLEEFAVALSETMKAIKPKLDKFNELNAKLSV